MSDRITNALDLLKRAAEYNSYQASGHPDEHWPGDKYVLQATEKIQEAAQLLREEVADEDAFDAEMVEVLKSREGGPRIRVCIECFGPVDEHGMRKLAEPTIALAAARIRRGYGTQEDEDAIRTAYYVALGQQAERNPTRPPTLLPYGLFRAQVLARAAKTDPSGEQP